MPFIDRFIKVPIQVYNQTEAEVTGNRTYEDSFAYILPTDIDEMFPSNRVEGQLEDGPDIVQVYMKSGRGFVVELSINKFVELLNKHFAA